MDNPSEVVGERAMDLDFEPFVTVHSYEELQKEARENGTEEYHKFRKAATKNVRIAYMIVVVIIFFLLLIPRIGYKIKQQAEQDRVSETARKEAVRKATTFTVIAPVGRFSRKLTYRQLENCTPLIDDVFLRIYDGKRIFKEGKISTDAGLSVNPTVDQLSTLKGAFRAIGKKEAVIVCKRKRR